MPQYDWNEVIAQNPQGYVELNDGKRVTHGPLESIVINDIDWVEIRLKWRAVVQLDNKHHLPVGDWIAVNNEAPIMFPNFVVPFEIEETSEKGTRVRFGLSILYFQPVKGLDPSMVVGLDLSAT